MGKTDHLDLYLFFCCVWCVFTPEIPIFWNRRTGLSILNILFISCYIRDLFVLTSLSISSNLSFSCSSICVIWAIFYFVSFCEITSISLLICEGSVNSLPRFLSKMLFTFSKNISWSRITLQKTCFWSILVSVWRLRFCSPCTSIFSNSHVENNFRLRKSLNFKDFVRNETWSYLYKERNCKVWVW